MILTREQIDAPTLLHYIEACESEFGPWSQDEPNILRDLIDTARAYHDMRDAVLTLYDDWNDDEYDVVRPRDLRDVIESVGAK